MFTRTSTEPDSSAAKATSLVMSSGLVMSQGRCLGRRLAIFSSSAEASASLSASLPVITTEAPSLRNSPATAFPKPELEASTSTVLSASPKSMTIPPLCHCRNNIAQTEDDSCLRMKPRPSLRFRKHVAVEYVKVSRVAEQALTFAGSQLLEYSQTLQMAQRLYSIMEIPEGGSGRACTGRGTCPADTGRRRPACRASEGQRRTCREARESSRSDDWVEETRARRPLRLCLRSRQLHICPAEFASSQSPRS